MRSVSRSHKLLAIGAASMFAVSLLSLPDRASAEYQSLPSTSPESWTYSETLATLTQRSDAATRDSDAAETAAKTAGDVLATAKGALTEAQANQAAATTAQLEAKSALDSARTRDEKAKAQAVYNRAIGARHAAIAAVKSATGAVSKNTAALKTAQAMVTKTAAVSTLAKTRVSRLEYMYGPSADTAFTQLRSEYTFSGSRPDPTTWTTYDTTRSAKPTARDPRYVAVRNNNLEVSSYGSYGSGVCICTTTSRPTAPYGRFEVRAKVDRNADHGVAILLWPTERTGPESGEIDLAEFDQDRTQANFALHYDARNLQVQSHILGDYREWHTYRVDWNERGVAWYIDNNLFATVTDKAAIPTKPFQLVVQAGANSSKASNTSTTVTVSSVKVYAP